ncbi:FIST signal transduction protein [uncultured Paracoccus sp.]|uniref:FIST signal transduction protein n=1 Tax=Paracoccus sp. S1E-3 TaxID=2756130 RepID=UPI0015EEA913|nr:FIST N-terminal domain-containing protein [uncultured Paracoccus sp.]MBA4491118.1 FIST C-terminal domain-containing protein [Paracoccus sp. S1E-3]
MSLSFATEDAAAAIAELDAAAGAIRPILVLLFVSAAPRLQAIADGLLPRLPEGCRLIACSSMGEFHHGGYLHDRSVAVMFPQVSFRASVVELSDVSRLPVTEWMDRLRQAARDFSADPARNSFGILLTQSDAGQEEVVIATLDASLPWLNVVGGTVGDMGDSSAACMVLDRQLLRDSALLCMVETDLHVREVVFSHFTPTSQRMVVTATNDSDRNIMRLNDEPAAEEYARLIGVPRASLSPMLFARYPLLLHIADQYHVRAIAGVRADGGLELMSAVEPGSLLTLGEASDDIFDDMDAAFSELPQLPELVLGFDCILRRLAVEKSRHASELAELFGRYRIVGFNTLGEQHGGLHVNQTFVGLAFMPPGGKAADGDDRAA